MSLKKKLLTALTALTLLISTATLAFALPTTWYVAPGGAGTGDTNWSNAANDLKTVMQNASTGDQIWVASGTYTPGPNQLDTFTLKAGVKLYGGFAGSETTPDERNISANETILDGQEINYHIISVDVGATLGDTRVDGFTIKRGKTADDSYGNELYNFGAGIFASGAGLTIANCTLTENQGSRGTAVYLGDANQLIADCVFTNNSSNYDIIRAYNAELTVSNSKFIGNTGERTLYFISGYAPTDTYLAEFENCLFNGSSNHVIDIDTGRLQVSNSTFTNNGGSALRIDRSRGSSIVNSTFTGNETGVNAVANTFGDSVIANSIIWGNDRDINITPSAAFSFTFKNNIIPQLPTSRAEIIDGGGNINAEPMLISLDAYDNPATVSTDVYIYAPGTGSSAFSAGLPVGTPVSGDFLVPAHDQRGVNRPAAVATTAGSYQPATYYVTQNGTGTFDGSNWANAIKGEELVNAMALADEGDVFWLASGNYSPGPISADTFTLNSGVKIYGGFAGNEDSLFERDITANPTVLDGQNVNNRVLTAEEASGVVLDGLLITGSGKAGPVTQGRDGGGLYALSSDITIINCTFKLNYALLRGGAMFFENSNATIKNCVFIRNRVMGIIPGTYGGAIYNSENSYITIENSTFAYNSAGAGAAIYNRNNAVAIITNCTFADSAGTVNEGISINAAGGSVFVANTLFESNYQRFFSDLNGGILVKPQAKFFIANSIVHGGFNLTGDNITLSGDIPGDDSMIISLDVDLNQTAISTDVRVYGLTAGSPAIGTGLPAGTPIMSGDLVLARIPAYDQLGFARPITGGVAIGATEYIAPFVAVESVSLDKTTLSLNYWTSTSVDVATISATVLPIAATSKDITWTTSSSDITTVDQTGKVTAASGGPTGQATAIVTATTHNGLQASAQVTVTQRVSGITISHSHLNYNITTGYIARGYSATVTPSNAHNKSIEWSSSDSSIVSVAADGTVTGGAFPGTAIVTATTLDGGFKASYTVIVQEQDVTSISLNTSTLALKTGESETLIATVEPDHAFNKNVIWTSNNQSIATVDSTGNITAVSGGPTGQATAVITATAADGSEVAASCTVTVTQPATDITLNTSSLNLTVGGPTASLMATISPSNASDKTVTWGTSNSSIATVSNGIVTATGPGTATITATTHNNLQATCTVTVTKENQTITLDKTSHTLLPGESVTLIPTITPESSPQKTVRWSASNSSVATVTNGVVTAKSSGTVTITASLQDSDATATCLITVLSTTETTQPPTLPTGTPSGVKATSATLTKLPLNATAEQKAAAIKELADQMQNISEAGFEVNSAGYIVPTDIMISSAILGSNIPVTGSDLTKLPVFTAEVPNGQTAAVSFPVSGAQLLAASFDKVGLLKIVSPSQSELFTYQNDPTKFADRSFTILNRDNATLSTGPVDPFADYHLLVFVKDGGTFDLDGRVNGKVVDPIVIVQTEEKTPGDDKSSSGCNAGFALIALLAAIPLIPRKK